MQPRVYVAIGLLVLLVAAAALLPRLLETLELKQGLAERVSQATGLEVQIQGELDVTFSRGLQVTVNDVQLATGGENLVAFDKLSIGMELLPLLRQQARITSISLHKPVISITRDAEGGLNFKRPPPWQGTRPTLQLHSISIIDGTVRYNDSVSGSEFVASHCNIEADNLLLTASSIAGMLTGFDFAAELACAELRHNTVAVSNLNVTASGSEGVLSLHPVTMTAFGSAASASLQSDFNGAQPQHDVSLKLPQLHVGALFRELGVQQEAEGFMDFSTTLTLQGNTVDAISQSLSGQLSLQGQQLVIHGMDLDEAFSRYESSQNFNLVDVGAFFFAGPLGLVVTKGYDFATLMQGTGARSEIQALVSDWSLAAGVARAEDVAMATAANRLALQGAVDLHDKQYIDVTVALVDAHGCATIEQVIKGSFGNPEIGKPGILRSLAGPLVSLLQRGIELIAGSDCVPFYQGSLPAP